MKNNVKLIICLVTCCFILTILNACGYKEYAGAVKEQNLAMQQRRLIHQADQEAKRRAHKEKMLMLAVNAMKAAQATADKSDDVMVPMLVMTLENSWIMSEAINSMNYKPEQTLAIQAPDSFGDGVRKSTAAILGVGGIILGIQNSDNMAEIAVAGIHGAGTNITGNSNTFSSGSGDSLGTVNLTGEGAFSSSRATTTDNSDNSDNSVVSTPGEVVPEPTPKTE